LQGEFVVQKKLNRDVEQLMRSRDNFTRKLIHRVADTSITGIRVAGERTDIAKYHNLPEFIVCDNGPEFRSSVIFKWSQDNKLELSFTLPRSLNRMLTQKASMASSEKNVLT